MPPKKLFVKENEFLQQNHPEYTKMRIYPELGTLNRIVAFIRELAPAMKMKNLVVFSATHGGYVPLECAASFERVDIWTDDEKHRENLVGNLGTSPANETTKIAVLSAPPSQVISGAQVWFFQEGEVNISKWPEMPQIVISPVSAKQNITLYNDYKKYCWDDTGYNVYVLWEVADRFAEAFRYEIAVDNPQILTFDNLLHLAMIVKDAGPQFESMLQDNLPFIDRWTILDTGSTDDTVAIIERVLKKKRGNLYRGEFQNFKQARNLCLDYAETQHETESAFTIMLDDTYVIQGAFRPFLKEVRGDRFSNSLSLYITSHDNNYVSNRILREGSHLRYKYRIHEVLEERDNINIVVPQQVAWLLDRRFDYMETRTLERKRKDLEWLQEEISENPEEPRSFYYMAQTYMLLEEYEKAYYYFGKRAEFTNSGFIQERIDAIFEMGRLANFQLKRPWVDCQALYEKAHMIDPSRPEALYFIGIHFFMENSINQAYAYFKKAFELGFPEHCQHSLKPTISFHFVPKFLVKCCFFVNDFALGKKAAEYFFQYNKPNSEGWNEILSWHGIYTQLLSYAETENKPMQPFPSSGLGSKPLLIMVVDGGFTLWTGSDILNKGMGGSETCMIELARHIQAQGHFQCVVFCRCSKEVPFEGVEYKDLSQLYPFIQSNPVHSCIVSRYTEYLAPVSACCNVENLYLILHDLIIPETVIVKSRVQKIFCLTDWHSQYFKELYPAMAETVETFSYGIDFATFDGASTGKIPDSFIYSSHPERGLHLLLDMWPQIREFRPNAVLNIFCNMDGDWSNRHYPEVMNKIRQLLILYKEHGVINHGWVKKSVLADYWKKTKYWLYPCTFQETFCLTALEAAAAQVFTITDGLSALKETAAEDRTVLIPGDPVEKVWQEAALKRLFAVVSNPAEHDQKVKKNYEWAAQQTWASRGREMNSLFSKSVYQWKGHWNWAKKAPDAASTQLFLNILTQEFSSHPQQTIRVLEVGVWTGMSLIPIVQHLQDNCKKTVQATAIDAWENYKENGKWQRVVEWGVEAAFDSNVCKAGYQSCIEKRKGKSYTVLTEAVQNKEQYDFIYIDGSKTSLDKFADVLLGWSLLKPGGLMAVEGLEEIPDYENADKIGLKTTLNAFLKTIANQAQVLATEYRLYLMKSRGD